MRNRACGCVAVCVALSGLPVARAQPSSSPPSTTTPTQSKAKADYLEIPLTGEFGKEILAGGVKKALARAKGEGVKHIVFVLDSGGGVVEDAKAIAEVLKQFDDSFTYHAVIKKAFSASLWVLTMCDNWYCSPGGATGAAVVYSLRSGTGAVEVDAKMNGALAATLASVAEQKGHSGDAIRAMMLMDAKLYFNPPVPGGTASRLSAVQAPGGQEVDGPESVLSASMAQMVEWGLAAELPAGASPGESVGKALGATAWRSAGTAGAGAMKSTATGFAAAIAERDKALKQYQDAVLAMAQAAKAFDAGRAAADKFDPRSFPLEYDQYGKATSDSRRRRNGEIDRKVACLNDAVAAAKGIVTAQGNAKRASASYEAAHRKAAEASGLEAANLHRSSVEVPEIPKDLQALMQSTVSEVNLWLSAKRT